MTNIYTNVGQTHGFSGVRIVSAINHYKVRDGFLTLGQALRLTDDLATANGFTRGSDNNFWVNFE